MKIKRFFIVVGSFSTFAIASNAMANDGCKFMLCLGAKDPMAISECKPVVQKVLQSLNNGSNVPTCKMANGKNSRDIGSYVNYTSATFTPRCPTGTKQGLDSVVYHLGLLPKTMLNIKKAIVAGMPTGYVNQLFDNDLMRKGDKYSQRVCLSGSQTESLTIDDTTHAWYDNVQVMQPDNAKYEFSLFVNNELYSIHRF